MSDLLSTILPPPVIQSVLLPPPVIETTLVIGQGPAGPPGSAVEGTGDLNYVHTQGSASALWSITHGLGKFPSVTVLDSAGTQWEGHVTYVNQNSITIEFSLPFGGTAYLN